jgi:Fe-Mn family superoxide dismutase
MSPSFGQQPSGALLDAINDSFGSLDRYLARFTDALTTIQGSGWALLMFEPMAQQLEIVQVQNHDGAVLIGATPIIAADGWEHAFYVDYRNDKAKWATAFSQITDWEAAGKRFDAVLAAAAS